MRIYSRFSVAAKETERELIEMGISVHPESMQDKIVKDNDDFMTKELQGYGYKITEKGMKTLNIDFERLGGDLNYAKEEFMERIAEFWMNPGIAWNHRKEVWKEFIHNGRFAYTYNERLREQLEFIIVQLTQNPNTRQAVVTMYDRHQDMVNMGGGARIPCSMYYQFLRRWVGGVQQLEMIYTMRSCDLYTHYIYDVWFAMSLQKYIADRLHISPGTFTHFIGSLHAYKKDFKDKGVF